MKSPRLGLSDVIRRSEHGKAPAILFDNRGATFGVHHPVARPYAGIVCEQIADRVEVMIVDREAVTRGKPADRQFGLDAVEPQVAVRLIHRAIMGDTIRSVQTSERRAK